MSGKNKKQIQVKHALMVMLITFVIACLISMGSQSVLSRMRSIFVAFLLLLIVIALGIVFDVIGVAVTAADEAPLNARAARKIHGAQISLRLVKNADKVANLCNDVVGDICGTLSGAFGSAIIFSLFAVRGELNILLPSVIMTGIVAALTVGGKALCKSLAINNATAIVIAVGQAIYAIRSVFGIREGKSTRRQSEKNRKRD